VLDVGGAAGAYALWLAGSGYRVHLLDVVHRLVALARARSAVAVDPLASASVGDARALPFKAESADMILLLGPLYHLQDASDRRRALEEAARVLRPGGTLFAACITRWASLLDGLTHGYLSDPAFARLVREDLLTGRHENPTEHEAYFTTAYFHRPEEFKAELEGAGLHLVGVYGLEGPAGLLPDFDRRWAEAERRAELFRVAQELEAEPSALGISAHLLGVCTKAGPDAHASGAS
jgi:SAM-dependent methyltransferase